MVKRTTLQIPASEFAFACFFDAGNESRISEPTTSDSHNGTVHREFDFNSELVPLARISHKRSAATLRSLVSLDGVCRNTLITIILFRPSLPRIIPETGSLPVQLSLALRLHSGEACGPSQATIAIPTARASQALRCEPHYSSFSSRRVHAHWAAAGEAQARFCLRRHHLPPSP